MNVELLVIADGANTDAGGKLNIFGIWDTVGAPAAPLVHPACTVALKMRFEKIEEGQKALKIAIVDADGREVFPTLTSNIQVRVPQNSPSGTLQILLQIQQLTLPHFGEYEVNVALDGRVVGSTPLFAKQIQPPQLPGQLPGGGGL
jgi:hypothetical protein